MQGRKDYTKEELDHAKTAIDQQLAAYKKFQRSIHRPDRHELRVSGGAAQVSFDTSASRVERMDASPVDGVESRVKSRR